MSALLVGYIGAVLLLTITPGLDTALILRTSLAQSQRQAVFAALGIGAGLLCWGAMVALGLGALLIASPLAFTLLKWSGACYLAWMGINMLLKPRTHLQAKVKISPRGALSGLRTGLMTNLLNPKIGVFYVSFLPQFIPHDASVAGYAMILATIHVGLGVCWSLVLIGLTRPLSVRLSSGSIVRWMDRMTGGVFLLFAARLALFTR